MKVSLIIGAGQLGSRHLQGLLRLEQEQIIFVVDPSEISLEMSKDRAKEIPNTHTVNFFTDWQMLPSEFDLVIVATGANVRAKLVTQLLESYKVKKLILEKVLFQDLKSYEMIGNLIESTNTPTWVNHPRRMLKHYQDIKTIIAESNEKVIFGVVGSNWGLACSALHFIDLFAFLSSSSVSAIDMEWIDNTIYQSKRLNNIEFTGTVKGVFKDDSCFVISSLDGQIGDITVFISTNSHRWIVQEGRVPRIIYMGNSNGFKEEISEFDTEFQTSLTTRVANELFTKDNTMLPTYEESKESHIPFVKAALKKYIEVSGIETTICPIT